MKRNCILAAFLLFGCTSFSQLRLGLLGGPHSASILESNQLPGWDTATKPFYSNRSGLHVGILAELPLGHGGHWYLQPGLLYMAKGRKYFQQNDTVRAEQTDTLSYSHNFFTNYIEMPVNLTYKIRLGKRSSFVLSAGPYFSFFYNGKNSYETRTYVSNTYSKEEYNVEVGKASNKVRTLDIGWNARAGFDLGGVFLSGFMSQGLTNFYQSDYDATFHHRVIGGSLCLWLNKAAPVERKARDRDKDGIPDSSDACPLLAGSITAKGCPDKDADGIADAVDKCPDTPGLARYQGCPIPDTDGDGLNDEEDKCPTVAGLPRYQGCPIPDRDGDGINDEEDKCPDKAGLAKYGGCPIPDSDSDGVNDEEDKCPTVAGPVSNHGCPEIKKEIVERVNYAARNIFFALNSDRLEKKSYTALDEVAGILDENNSIMLYVDGYTDNTGKPEYNLNLSQKRADAVKQYLIAKGIDANRIKATGFGQEKPLADNKTAAGRARNRRVEMRLEYK